MLKTEDAEKQLKQWTVEPKDDWFLESIARLPKALRTLGYRLFSREDDGSELPPPRWDHPDSYDFDQRLAERRAAAVHELGKLAVKDRRKFFTAFLPNLADAIELLWNFLKSLPFGIGYARKPFRAPQTPEATTALCVESVMALFGLAEHLQPEVVTPVWLAQWLPHLNHLRYRNQREPSLLLAAVINAGGTVGDEVFEILCASARNEHAVGAMGRHVVRCLLSASRVDGWSLMERTLIAAQRQEGLRQVILETIDEAHPEAFRRMLKLLREENLVRFSSVVRAVDVWLEFQWDSVSTKVVSQAIERVEQFLDDAAARQKALDGKEAESAFLALWATAYTDAARSLPLATKLLKHARPEMRFVAAFHLSQLGSFPGAKRALWPLIDDDDLRVAFHAAQYSSGGEDNCEESSSSRHRQDDRFERLERLFARTPETPKKLPALVWPWTAIEVQRTNVSRMLFDALNERPPSRLLPYLSEFDPSLRSRAVAVLSRQQKWDRETRDTLLQLAGDSSSMVRGAAFGVLDGKPLQGDEPQRLEGYLTRKTADLRDGAMKLLVQQKDAAALASADRLLAAKDVPQRLAGLEVLRRLAGEDRQRKECIARAASFRQRPKAPSTAEETQLKAIESSNQRQVTAEDGLGLLDRAARTPVEQPQTRKVKFATPAAVELLKSLDALIHEHREDSFKFTNYAKVESEMLLGAVQYYEFGTPNVRKPIEEEVARLPLRDLWENWYANRPKSQRDPDGLELERAALLRSLRQDDWRAASLKKWIADGNDRKAVFDLLHGGHTPPPIQYATVLDCVLAWLQYLHPVEHAFDRLLDLQETVFASVSPQDHKLLATADTASVSPHHYSDDAPRDWRSIDQLSPWWSQLTNFTVNWAQRPTSNQVTRLWKLARWYDEPIPNAVRHRPDIELFRRAYAAGVATQADFFDLLIGGNPYLPRGDFRDLSHLTMRTLPAELRGFIDAHPELLEDVTKVRERLLEIELARGEAPTPASYPALALQSVHGIDTLVRVLTAVGTQDFKQQPRWAWRQTTNRITTLTHLLSVCYPSPDDTPEQFAARVIPALPKGKIEERLLQLVFIAPQWTRFIEQTLKWPGLMEGVYWYLAHMSDGEAAGGRAASDEDDSGAGGDNAASGVGTTEGDDSTDADAAETCDSANQPNAWERLIRERTPLTKAERVEGAIDVAWFTTVVAALGVKRWQALAASAKFAATPAQAKKAQLLGDILLGKASRKQLVAEIKTKRLKQTVQWFGLMPLATGAKREAELLDRYKVLQEYQRYAKTLSGLTKPSALRAVEIGMQNLARTAGYADPLRLEWSMEARATADLAAGPVSAKKGDVTVTLSLDEQSQPVVAVARGDKPLKSVPPDIKQDKHIAALLERVTDVRRQASRVKQSLEGAMVRGDSFTGDELRRLAEHAILWPQLARLVLIGEGILGYPDKRGRALRDAKGKLEPVKPGETLRIAHAHDLFAAKNWQDWQHECFAAERRQPFKQVFRELYVLTKQEQRDGKLSHRYAGQQVNPTQATALWGSRGWSTQEGIGKTYHADGITVDIGFQSGGWSPLEVEGWTLDQMSFHTRDDWKPMPLKNVPPRVFSEAMRDLDLVVSVAHRGGVDPEASASTVEMRARLVDETARLLGLKNLKLKPSHVVIDGHLAQYSIHLGSGVVHRLPGGAVCIVPVHAQHRGRLFLPFADDDPKTAEVVSKVLLLARDSEIQDPTVLEQLRG